MPEVYVCKAKKLGELGEGVMRRKSAWLPVELMQAISIAQTVIKPLKQHDYWIESATKLLAGSILYLHQRLELLTT